MKINEYVARYKFVRIHNRAAQFVQDIRYKLGRLFGHIDLQYLPLSYMNEPRPPAASQRCPATNISSRPPQ